MALDLVFTKYPVLTSNGLGVVLDEWRYRPPRGREAEFDRELKKGRQELVDRYPAICVIATWLEACQHLACCVS